MMGKFRQAISCLLMVVSVAHGHAISHVRRDIPNIGQFIMRGDISAVASWMYAALAYSAIQASNSTTELTKLCDLSSNVSTRYMLAFPESSGDIVKFAREAVCSAAKSSNPSPEPKEKTGGNLWWIKSYLAAVFTAQSYYGDQYNSTYSANLCWYVESSLLEGLWIPTPDYKNGLVDAESSFCATAGYYAKDEVFMYTNATQPTDTVLQVNELISKVMVRAVQLVLKTEDEISYFCTNFGTWKNRVNEMGFMSDVIVKEVCGGQKKVKELGDAKKSFLDAMTDLYSFQLLHAGNAPDYPQWLCQSLKKEKLDQIGLHGAKVIGDSCKASKKRLLAEFA